MRSGDAAPMFDSLVAEGGNPLGPHQDMPVPRFDLGAADPPTVRFLPVRGDGWDASALALLDNGQVPAAIDPPT